MAKTRLIIGCGYLGRRVAAQWQREGERVFVLTRSPQHAAEFEAAGLVPLLGDITSPSSLPEFPSVDTLLYAVGLDRQSGKSMHEVYVGGLSAILPRIAKKVSRVLYISSTSVYGQDGGEWVDETSVCEPLTANGQTCLAAERLLQQALPAANLLRLAGIYGPGRLIARMESLRAGIAPEGNPDAWLNLIHVDDAGAAVRACEQHGTPGSTYLVSDNRPIRRREYYSQLASLIGAPDPFPASSPATDPTEYRPPRQVTTGYNKRCSNQRLRAELQVRLVYPDMTAGLPAALEPAG